jgi:AcrR family transcriptional regulator
MKAAKTRRYAGTVRAAAAAENRERTLAAAIALLRRSDVAEFSLEAVAKAAKLTRLTVYNQFGSRRGLLEAVFDGVAERGGLMRLGAAMQEPDPFIALDRIVVIFCDFWSGEMAVGRLHDAMALDPEFALAMTERNERRRHLVEALLSRVPGNKKTGHNKKRDAIRDATDLIFALTSNAMFRLLTTNRSDDAAATLIRKACADAVDFLR